MAVGRLSVRMAESEESGLDWGSNKLSDQEDPPSNGESLGICPIDHDNQSVCGSSDGGAKGSFAEVSATTPGLKMSHAKG